MIQAHGGARLGRRHALTGRARGGPERRDGRHRRVQRDAAPADPVTPQAAWTFRHPPSWLCGFDPRHPLHTHHPGKPLRAGSDRRPLATRSASRARYVLDPESARQSSTWSFPLSATPPSPAANASSASAIARSRLSGRGRLVSPTGRRPQAAYPEPGQGADRRTDRWEMRCLRESVR